MFQIASRTDATIVHVQCEIDFSVKADFREVLTLACSNASVPLVVSLEDCPYMDCAGLSVLLDVQKTARVPLSVILRSDSFLWKLFLITGLVERLNVTDTREPVIAA